MLLQRFVNLNPIWIQVVILVVHLFRTFELWEDMRRLTNLDFVITGQKFRKNDQRKKFKKGAFFRVCSAHPWDSEFLTFSGHRYNNTDLDLFKILLLETARISKTTCKELAIFDSYLIFFYAKVWHYFVLAFERIL